MSTAFSLEGKNAVVTGLSTGIGRAIAEALAREGANVAGDFQKDAEGAAIQIYAAYNEQDEARFVVEQIKRWIDEGRKAEDSAILYRTTAQSRLFEEHLLRESIPYRVYGGQRFFERLEVKDALAYLRLLQNPHDDAALERVINKPTRAIGEKTIAELRIQAREANVTLWQAIEACLAQQKLAPRAAGAVQTGRRQ